MVPDRERASEKETGRALLWEIEMEEDGAAVPLAAKMRVSF